MTHEVTETREDSDIASFLERDRLWTAYGLCDLDEPYRRSTRFLAAEISGRNEALLVVYDVPRFTGLLPFGEAPGIRSIVALSEDLPTMALVLTDSAHSPALEVRYHVGTPRAMLRMAVSAETFIAPAESVHAVRLSAADLADIEQLYRTPAAGALLDETAFAHGVYFGIRVGGELVAVAGTHAWSARYRVGAVGGVYTHPGFRGRGFAAATTAAVTSTLLRAGVADVVLNVRADNAPALRAYGHLGFTTVRKFLEVEASARADTLQAPSRS